MAPSKLREIVNCNRVYSSNSLFVERMNNSVPYADEDIVDLLIDFQYSMKYYAMVFCLILTWGM